MCTDTDDSNEDITRAMFYRYFVNITSSDKGVIRQVFGFSLELKKATRASGDVR